MPEADYFLEIYTRKGGKVKGEADSDACPEQIEVTKFKLGIQSPTDVGTKQATGRIELQEAEFTFDTNTATVALFNAICTNDSITKATLTCRKAGGNGGGDMTFLQWRFTDARVVSYEQEGDGDIPDDKIKIAYTGIEVSYKFQKEDGKLSPAMTGAYSSAENSTTRSSLGN